MNGKAIFEEDRNLLLDQSSGLRLHTAYEGGGHHAHVRTDVSSDETSHHLLTQAPVARHLVIGPDSLLRQRPDSPGSRIEGPEPLDFQQLNLRHLSPVTESLRRKTVNKEKDFHDSEDEDVYDLFNACNGIVLENDLLDISQLDDYSPDEAEALNVPRLREIWAHTASGCPQCAGIIRTLNDVRGTLREEAEELLNGQAEEMDIDAVDSAS